MEQKAFKDDYEHESEELEYVLENILQEDDGSEEFRELEEMFRSSILSCCNCENCSDKCEHGENYIIEGKEMVLRDDRRCADLIYECNESCKCKVCDNKLVQYGPRDGLMVIKSEKKGCGLVSSKFVPKGSFICEYAGELLTKSEAVRRDRQNQAENKMNYIFCLNEISSSDGTTTQTFVDPSVKGNIGRYINHSCDANCDTISTRVDSIIPKIAIFANRDIPALTEITFNYGSEGRKPSEEKQKPCHCQSSNCRLYLPNFSF